MEYTWHQFSGYTNFNFRVFCCRELDRVFLMIRVFIIYSILLMSISNDWGLVRFGSYSATPRRWILNLQTLSTDTHSVCKLLPHKSCLIIACGKLCCYTIKLWYSGKKLRGLCITLLIHIFYNHVSSLTNGNICDVDYGDERC